MLYTDGVTEATDLDYNVYGEERFEQLLGGLTKASCQQIIDTVRADVKTFVGEAEQSDDITLLAVRRK
jgi:sigma-B regulation protein RsbU (phosphoserine phosphatase)